MTDQTKHALYEERVEVIKVKSNLYKKENSTSSFSDSTSVEVINSENGGFIPDLEWTEEEERRVLFKIDTRLMPFVLLMTFVLNMDRTNISNAISDNLPADLGFGIDGVNTGILIYSVVFTLVTLITTPIVNKVGAHVWIPILMTSWAVVTWAHALLKNYPGFLAVRFFIALTEAGFIPACLYYLSFWYKTNELATRLSWFWGIQSFASACSGLISFAVFNMSGVGGLYGWMWLFVLEGIFTHIIGFIAILFVPSGPFYTKGGLRGKKGWFTEKEAQIAVTRIIRDDTTKLDKAPVTWHDVKISVLDTRLLTHLAITFLSIMPNTPVTTYLPTLIKGYGFSVTTGNLLTAPSYIINLIFSIIITRSADKRGNYAYHAFFGCVWSMAGFLALILLPSDVGRWNSYAAALFVSSSPMWHGMHIAWMASNLAPIGKRTLALGAVIGAANICGVPGSQIYRADDAPKFVRGNWVNFGIIAASGFLLLVQHTRYTLTNKLRNKKWSNMTDADKKSYLENTKDEGSARLDYRFRL